MLAEPHPAAGAHNPESPRSGRPEMAQEDILAATRLESLAEADTTVAIEKGCTCDSNGCAPALRLEGRGPSSTLHVSLWTIEALRSILRSFIRRPAGSCVFGCWMTIPQVNPNEADPRVHLLCLGE
jgi:hypothetical protein